jgi:hypothetical protein
LSQCNSLVEFLCLSLRLLEALAGQGAGFAMRSKSIRQRLAVVACGRVCTGDFEVDVSSCLTVRAAAVTHGGHGARRVVV